MFASGCVCSERVSVCISLCVMSVRVKNKQDGISVYVSSERVHVCFGLSIRVYKKQDGRKFVS